MQVPQKALNGSHLGTAQCAKGADRKRRRLAETETRENSERAFREYGQPMEAVTESRYLGRLLTATDDDWPVVAGNIEKARRSWGWLAKVLVREGADPKVSLTLYIAVTQQVLLFGEETRVLTEKMGKALDAFQGRVVRKLTGRHPRRGRWGVVLPVTGGSDEGGRDCSELDLNPSEAEYGRAIYCDAADSEPV